MTKETKLRICDEAVRLFNERGYEAVSMRDIASAAGTTIGNMTYHFSKKQDLLDRLLVDLHRDFSTRLDPDLTARELLETLVNSFSKAGRNEAKFSFYFSNIESIYLESDSVREENNVFEFALRDFYVDCFTRLQDHELVQERFSKEELSTFAMLMVHLECTWMLKCVPNSNPLFKTIPISSAMTLLLKMILTDDGQALLEEVLRTR